MPVNISYKTKSIATPRFINKSFVGTFVYVNPCENQMTLSVKQVPVFEYEIYKMKLFWLYT